MEFKTITELLEDVKNQKTVDQKFNVMETFFKEVKNKLATYLESQYQPKDFYSVLRLIVPILDRERPAYNIKETKIARILIKMLSLGQCDDRNTLMHAGGSNFPEVVFTIVTKYISSFRSTLSVDELNNYLDRIAKRDSDVGIDEVMLQMFRKGSPNDVKWIVRILLKQMRLGINNDRILNAFHKDGSAYFKSNANLLKVCEALWDSQVRLNELQMVVFQPFRPMLSKQCNAQIFRKEITEDKMFLMENKFDGERFQLHMDSGNFKYFSRRSFDFTKMYGASYEEGILTPLLKNCFANDVQRIVLDGEMMLWNKYSKKFGSKGMNLDVKHLTSLGKYQPCFCVYDILLLNEDVLTNVPLTTRLKVLRKSIKQTIEGTLMISKYVEVKSRQEIIDGLNSSVDLQEEGIVLKNPSSVYKFDDRNGGWYKMKLEYFDDGVHDMDLLLMGASKENNRYVSFFVGLRSKNMENNQAQYLSFAKVVSGVSDLEMEMLAKRFEEKGHDFQSFGSQSKGSLQFGRETPDVWIEPDDSFVFVIRASELTRSTSDHFKTHYSLRFPRVLQIRDDKPAEACLSLAELLELTGENKAVIKLSKRQLDLEEVLKVQPKAKRAVKQIESTVALKQSSDFLEGFKFYIYSSELYSSINEIENTIRRAKGFVTVKMDPEVDIVLVDAVDSKLFDFIKNNENFDVVAKSWLQRSLDAQEVLPYKQEEIVNLSYIENYMSQAFDRYGDSFLEESTFESIKRTIHLMDQKDDPLRKKNKTGPFEDKVAYFDTYEIINDDTSTKIYDPFLDQMEFEFRKGIVSSTLNPHVDLIVINTVDRRRPIEEYLATQNLKCKIVNGSFLYEY